MLPKALVAASGKPIVLTLLSEGEMYGYQIIHRTQSISNGRITWTASKLYPLLHQLEYDGLVSATWRPSKSGPDRKYYQLTPKGEKALEAIKRDWKDVIRVSVTDGLSKRLKQIRSDLKCRKDDYFLEKRR